MKPRVPSILAICAACALPVAGCQQADTAGQGEGADPAYTIQETPNSPRDPANAVRLGSGGLEVIGATGTTLAFDSPRETVENELARVLGPIADRGRNEECGAGAVDSTRFPGGLTLNFQQGRLVGWYLSEEAQYAGAAGDIATAAGIRPGSSAAALRSAYDVNPVADSTLGNEFVSSQGVSGFLTGSQDAQFVEALYAGTTCFFR